MIRIEHKAMRRPYRLQPIPQQKRLVYRYERILTPMQNQRWRVPRRCFAKNVDQFWTSIAVGVEQLSHPNTGSVTVEPVKIIGARVQHRSSQSFHMAQHRGRDRGTPRDTIKQHVAAIDPAQLPGDQEAVLHDLPSGFFDRAARNCCGTITRQGNGKSSKTYLIGESFRDRQNLFRSATHQTVTMEQNDQRERPATTWADNVRLDIPLRAGVENSGGRAGFEEL